MNLKTKSDLTTPDPASLAGQLCAGNRNQFVLAIVRQFVAIDRLREPPAELSQDAATTARAMLTAACAIVRADELQRGGLQTMRELEADAFRRGSQAALAAAAQHVRQTHLSLQRVIQDQESLAKRIEALEVE